MLDDLHTAIAAVSRAQDPYWAAVELHGVCAGLMESFGVAYRLYWLWATLTDRYELRPDQRPAVEATMVRAADEWFLVEADREARDAYLERWLFNELGLTRTIGREF
jgi:uncharacterized membrane protein